MRELLKVQIRITLIEEVQELYDILNSLKEDVVCTRGRICVDGKSILGLMAIDTSKPFIVEYVVNPNDDAERNFLINQLQKWIVE